jgi:nitrate reductase molybdenum cofactor assembly chaperone NarJ/NarW
MTGLDDVQRSRALRAAAQLLSYPDEALLGMRHTLVAVASSLPPPAGAHLAAFCDYLATTPLSTTQAAYVDTFDLRRRCCPYLTYYVHGDTRKRGMALLRFTHAYRLAGLPPPAGELPDHLAVVCEFAAIAPRHGLRLLAEHRAAVELLRMALADAGSPYLDVVDAVRAALPEPAPKDLTRALELARSGPPAEEVGLEPFGPPERAGGRR